MSLELALEDARAADARGDLCYQRIADARGVDCITLSRRHRGVRMTM